MLGSSIIDLFRQLFLPAAILDDLLLQLDLFVELSYVIVNLDALVSGVVLGDQVEVVEHKDQ